MTVYYIKQFGLYYAGTDPDGTINISNERKFAVAFTDKDAADKKCVEMGKEHCEIEECAIIDRVLDILG